MQLFGSVYQHRCQAVSLVPSGIQFSFIARHEISHSIEERTPEAIHAARQLQVVSSNPQRAWLQSKTENLWLSHPLCLLCLEA